MAEKRLNVNEEKVLRVLLEKFLTEQAIPPPTTMKKAVEASLVLIKKGLLKVEIQDLNKDGSEFEYRIVPVL